MIQENNLTEAAAVAEGSRAPATVAVLYKRIAWVAAVLALCVVVLGAYVRLSDAGLGCPDWPGCYGHIAVPQAPSSAFAGQVIQPAKAWKEMIHRYVAGTLGMLIVALLVLAWRFRRQLRQSPLVPTLVSIVVIFQALLGMWTVTIKLMPVIVSSHLLGGMTTMSLLFLIAARQVRWRLPDAQAARRLQGAALLGLVILALQIALGGWTSTNYAALACSGFPTCNGQWLPPMDFHNGFALLRDLGRDAAGGVISGEALAAIHWTHRVGALVTFLYLGWLAHKAARLPALKAIGRLLAVLLVAQVLLGISNVLFALPLPVAVAHNAGAALLLVTMVVLNYTIHRAAGQK